jgi:predicted N-acetyltransferase YhbS
LKTSGEDALVRPCTASERGTVLQIHRNAFGQSTEADLVDALLQDPTARPFLSLLAFRDDQPAGHILFTPVRIGQSEISASILCPLAVSPELQRSGVGSALIETGLQTLKQSGCQIIFVLGDPTYYGRFGFKQADYEQFPTPHPIPKAYLFGWMVQGLGVDPSRPSSGQLACASALNKPEYWSD